MPIYLSADDRLVGFHKIPRRLPEGAQLIRSQAELAACRLSVRKMVLLIVELGGQLPPTMTRGRDLVACILWNLTHRLLARVEAREARTAGKVRHPGLKGPPARGRPPAGGQPRAKAAMTLLARPRGASIAELTGATGWQAASVRAFLSRLPARHPGLKLVAVGSRDGVRRLRASPARRP